MPEHGNFRSSVHPSEIPFVRRHNEKGSLWTQLLLQFLTDLFESLQVFLSWSEDVHLVWGLGLSSRYFFLSTFPTYFGLVFFQVRLLCVWAQLLEFSTDHFETMHTCSTWSVDVHEVLELSSHYFYQLFLLFRLSFSQVGLLLE